MLSTAQTRHIFHAVLFMDDVPEADVQQAQALGDDVAALAQHIHAEWMGGPDSVDVAGVAAIVRDALKPFQVAIGRNRFCIGFDTLEDAIVAARRARHESGSPTAEITVLGPDANGELGPMRRVTDTGDLERVSA